MKGLSKIKLTAFEWKVLAATVSIPLGETRSYAWVARQVGRPKAARAVGQALKKNPFPLIIPCHRVIRRDGSPGGYAGRFSPQKMRLLKIEEEIARRIAKSAPFLLNSRQGRSRMKKIVEPS